MTVSIATLDRRISRAVEAGKGMRLEAGDIDLLVTHGILPVIHAASAVYLKEQARCRDMRRRSTGAENTGSTGTESETEPSGLRTLEPDRKLG